MYNNTVRMDDFHINIHNTNVWMWYGKVNSRFLKNIFRGWVVLIVTWTYNAWKCGKNMINKWVYKTFPIFSRSTNWLKEWLRHMCDWKNMILNTANILYMHTQYNFRWFASISILIDKYNIFCHRYVSTIDKTKVIQNSFIKFRI